VASSYVPAIIRKAKSENEMKNHHISQQNMALNIR